MNVVQITFFSFSKGLPQDFIFFQNNGCQDWKILMIRPSWRKILAYYSLRIFRLLGLSTAWALSPGKKEIADSFYRDRGHLLGLRTNLKNTDYKILFMPSLQYFSMGNNKVQCINNSKRGFSKSSCNHFMYFIEVDFTSHAIFKIISI